MKKLLLILFIAAFSIQMRSQVNFEKAYFIDNKNIKTECYIKNKDLYDNPTSFEYKIKKEESKSMVNEIKNIKEFGIDGLIKFERNFVKIDISNANLNELSEKKEPEWSEKILFLRVLIEGGATLYEYKADGLKRYFYKLDNQPVEQLVYKKYFEQNSSHTKLAINKEYQQQLWLNLRSVNIIIDKIYKLEYTKEDLSNYFIEYNTSKKYSFTDYKRKAATGSFNLKLKGGIDISLLQLYYLSGDVSLDFGSKFSLNLGTETEYIMPFNRNKWSIYIEAGYGNYETARVIKEPSSSGVLFENSYKWEVSNKYIDLALGFRHYIFLNDKSSIFINGTYGFGVPMNSRIKKDGNIFYEIHTSEGFSYGFGYNYNGKYSIEFRRKSNPLDKYYSFSQFNTSSLVLGYKLFNNNKHKQK